MIKSVYRTREALSAQSFLIHIFFYDCPPISERKKNHEKIKKKTELIK